MLIRQIKHQDITLLKTIAEHTFRSAWQAQNPTLHFEQYCKECFSTHALKQEMDAPGTLFFFAEWNDQTVGYLKVNKGKAPHDWEGDTQKALQLERIYVTPTQQNMGVGNGLLHFVDYMAQSEGFNYIWLSVWQEAPRSIAFYEKNGFKIHGTEDFWLGDERQTDWVMCKSIF